MSRSPETRSVTRSGALLKVERPPSDNSTHEFRASSWWFSIGCACRNLAKSAFLRHPKGIHSALSPVEIPMASHVFIPQRILGGEVLGDDDTWAPDAEVDPEQDLVMHSLGVNRQNAEFTR